jgi:hypothetical protein
MSAGSFPRDKHPIAAVSMIPCPTHLDLCVHTRTQQQMTTLGEQPDRRDTLVVSSLHAQLRFAITSTDPLTQV